jgi:plasmid maintenance system antidote protein VapI
MKCKAVALSPRISGDELRARIKRLGMTYTEAAERLGLTLDGLNKQMRGVNAVSRQTAIILRVIEAEPRRPSHDATRRRQITEKTGARQ